MKTQVIDLFCGIWWLSHWFVKEGFRVVAGIDFESSCKFAFESNNNSIFIEKDIREVSASDVNSLYDKDTELKILVWCAPCQPFSLMNTKKWQYSQDYINLRSPIHAFANIIKEIQPDIVSMENVPGIAKKDKYDAFTYFLDTLEEYWYHTTYQIVDCTKYGIPQTRKRFVLIASKLWKIELPPPTHIQPVTVKETIWDLTPIRHGEWDGFDKYHRARALNKENYERIKNIPKDGWSLMDVSEKYRPECYKKKSGKSYINNVYWRMRRDKAAPTMTTFCTGLWNGRFGHPEQDRAISVREAARIQTFPDNYKFVPDNENVPVIKVSKQIGNAVPVRLWEIIAQSIKNFLFDKSII